MPNNYASHITTFKSVTSKNNFIINNSTISVFLSDQTWLGAFPITPSTNTSIAISRLALQQPWETPGQAEAICCRILERAGFSELPPPDSNQDATTATNEHSITMEQLELLQLIAFCWWKKGVPLGDLVSSATKTTKIDETHSESVQQVVGESESKATSIHWKVLGGQEFRRIFHNWKEDYLPKRWRGLSSAMDRWMNHDGGLITSVRDDEME